MTTDQSNVPPMFRVEWVPVRMLRPFPKPMFAAQVDCAEPRAYLAQAGGAKKNVALLVAEGNRWVYHFYQKGEWKGGDSSAPTLAGAQAFVTRDIAALV